MSRIQMKGSPHFWREFGCVMSGSLQPIQDGFRALNRSTRKLLRGSWRRALASLALPLTAGTLHAQVPNPACYLPFDEGTGTVAHDAAGTNNATLLGGAGWIKGIVGPFALSVPGTNGSYADIPADVVSTTQSFTVCAWVNLNSVPGYQTFVSEDAGYQSAFFLHKRADTSTFTFTTNTGAISGPGTTVFAELWNNPSRENVVPCSRSIRRQLWLIIRLCERGTRRTELRRIAEPCRRTHWDRPRPI